MAAKTQKSIQNGDGKYLLKGPETVHKFGAAERAAVFSQNAARDRVKAADKAGLKVVDAPVVAIDREAAAAEKALAAKARVKAAAAKKAAKPKAPAKKAATKKAPAKKPAKKATAESATA